jgi:hypothetical protein
MQPEIFLKLGIFVRTALMGRLNFHHRSLFGSKKDCSDKLILLSASSFSSCISLEILNLEFRKKNKMNESGVTARQLMYGSPLPDIASPRG